MQPAFRVNSWIANSARTKLIIYPNKKQTMDSSFGPRFTAKLYRSDCASTVGYTIFGQESIPSQSRLTSHYTMVL